MDACEVVRLIVNKTVVSEPKRRGNPGYGRLKAIRVLVYARLKGLENDTRIVEHLKKHKDAAKTLGLQSVPDRTTVGRWWSRYLSLLEETFQKTACMLQLIAPTTHLIADSTPLVDLYDMEAKWGFTKKGKFRGFKLHAVVNQLGLPLKAIVTTGNCYDSPFLPKLIEDLEAQYVLADAGYDSKRNVEVIEAMGAVPVIVRNPRRQRRRGKPVHPKLLREKRYLVEQFNGHVKDNVLKHCWVRPRGLVKKTAMVTAGLISYDAEAVKALILEESSLKNVSKYWA
ncbi:MAG: transposase [Candidatus Bathyarchaeia archaeon]|jgi:transposase